MSVGNCDDCASETTRLLLLYVPPAAFCRVFGHFSHRSEWQLVKVDYKSIFDRRCEEEDYRPWQLHSQVRSEDPGMWPEVANDPTVQDQHNLVSFPNHLVSAHPLLGKSVVLHWCVGLRLRLIPEGWTAVFWVSSCTQTITSDLCRLEQYNKSRRTATEVWTRSLLHIPSNFPILNLISLLCHSVSSEPAS